MNHEQLRSCQRLHEQATVATGPINVDSQDVRNLLDATAHAYRTMELTTNELREAKTQLLERAVVEPVPDGTTPAAVISAHDDAVAANLAVPAAIVTPAGAGS